MFSARVSVVRSPCSHGIGLVLGSRLRGGLHPPGRGTAESGVGAACRFGCVLPIGTASRPLTPKAAQKQPKNGYFADFWRIFGGFFAKFSHFAHARGGGVGCRRGTRGARRHLEGASFRDRAARNAAPCVTRKLLHPLRLRTARSKSAAKMILRHTPPQCSGHGATIGKAKTVQVHSAPGADSGWRVLPFACWLVAAVSPAVVVGGGAVVPVAQSSCKCQNTSPAFYRCGERLCTSYRFDFCL